MASSVIRRIGPYILGLFILLFTLSVIEHCLLVFRGRGIFIPRSRFLRPPDWWAYRDLGAIRGLCWQRLGSGAGPRPSPQDLVDSIPHLLLAKEQPYLKHRIWVLESDDCGEQYLYSPYSQEDFGSGTPIKVFACNVASLKERDGRRYVYTTDGNEDHHVIVTCVGMSRIYTGGVPVVPGCEVAETSETTGEEHVLPMAPEVLQSLRACYPDVEVPPELIKR